jgi:hypothetical protein
MASDARMRPPAGLEAAGRALWASMHGALAEGLRFTAMEREILVRACRLADREAGLRAILDRDGLMSTGSKGQLVLHPVVGELRLVEPLLVGLLRQVSVSDTGGRVETPTRRRAAKAARARWDRERDELAAKREAAGLG